jgi:RNA polymerase subunit RPABC4/transcription elongation factor Spt4
MADMRYCPHCGHDVNVSRWTGARIIIMLLLIFFLLPVGIIYLIYVAAREVKCPVCGTPGRYLEPPRYGGSGFAPEPPPSNPEPPRYTGDSNQLGTATDIVICPVCGAKNKGGYDYCSMCGAKLK